MDVVQQNKHHNAASLFPRDQLNIGQIHRKKTRLIRLEPITVLGLSLQLHIILSKQCSQNPTHHLPPEMNSQTLAGAITKGREVVAELHVSEPGESFGPVLARVGPPEGVVDVGGDGVDGDAGLLGSASFALSLTDKKRKEKEK
jgi:hypothetical protein